MIINKLNFAPMNIKPFVCSKAELKTTLPLTECIDNRNVPMDAKAILIKLKLNAAISSVKLRDSILSITNKLEDSKDWIPSAEMLVRIKNEYKNYPYKSKVNLQNLNNKEGNAFIREAFFQIADLKSSCLDKNAQKVGDAFDHLKSATDVKLILSDIHKYVFSNVKKLASAKDESEMFKLTSLNDGNMYMNNNQRWTYWQQEGERLSYNEGHKKIFEMWPVNMQELSDLHRDIEALNHMMLSRGRVDDGKLFGVIKSYAQKILDDRTLEKMAQEPQNLVRDDIPSNPKEYHSKWRQMRTVQGSRDKHVIQEKLGIPL